MAKRKAAGGTKKAARTSSRAGGRSSGKKTASKSAKSARRSTPRATAKAARRRASPAGKAKTRKPKARRVITKRTKPAATKRAKAATASKMGSASRKGTPSKKGNTPKTAARKAAVATPRSAPPARARGAVKSAPSRKAPALDRERRTITDEEDEMVPMPPSTLDLDRSASAVRSGRRGMQQRIAEHTETSPAMTAGDVDADWESAYSVGDEAPGGDNPTPDQDIVDDIGRAVGVEYQDNEELKGEEKIARRDAHRWELDPASSEDWDDRD